LRSYRPIVFECILSAKFIGQIMRTSNQNFLLPVLLLLSVLFLGSCLTPQKMDKYVAEQYGNRIPKQNKNKKADINVSSTFITPSNDISTTIRKRSNFLPLIVYWQADYRHICTLNSSIAVNNFSNAVNTMTNKALSEKLSGQRLELTVEQIPTAFALVDKERVIWLLYAISWQKIYMEPDFKDLVVSYKVFQNDTTVKAGKISIKGDAHNKGLRFFQSWKSATSEYLADYNANINSMSKAFMNRLSEEL
jgi:hypothetical protein